MAPSVSLNNAAVASLAGKIAQARKVYGKDSSYVIGLLAGIDLLLTGDDGEALGRQIQDRVIEMESGKGGGAPAKAAAVQPKSRGQAAAPSPLAENEWIRGAVKWFNNDKGYGFISTDSETDVFVHWRDISSWDRSLTQGDEVEFMVTKTAKGFQAINVMKSDKGAKGEDAGEEAKPGSGEPGQGDAGPDGQSPDGVTAQVEGDPAPEAAEAPEASTSETVPAPGEAQDGESGGPGTEPRSGDGPVADESAGEESGPDGANAPATT